MAKKTSRRKVGRGTNITPRIMMTTAPIPKSDSLKPGINIPLRGSAYALAILLMAL